MFDLLAWLLLPRRRHLVTSTGNQQVLAETYRIKASIYTLYEAAQYVFSSKGTS